LSAYTFYNNNDTTTSDKNKTKTMSFPVEEKAL